MENNSQPSAQAAPAKVTSPANEAPKTTQASSNHEVVLMAARTATMDRSAAQPQRGTAVGSVPVLQHPQPLSRSLACRPVQQTHPVVFGQGLSSSNPAMQGSSSTQAQAATALHAATRGPTARYGAVPWMRPAAFHPAPRVRRTKLMTRRQPSPPPSPPRPKLPVYRPPAPPSPELASSSAAGNALLLPLPDTSFCVLNMQADPPSPDQVTMAEKASDSEGSGGSGDDVKMLDLNFPPVSDEEN